jgi:RND family efflux transporter MFP subunit
MQKGARPEDIKVLEAEVKAAKARSLNAEQQYKRYKDLYVQKQVSKSEFDKYKSERDVAKAQFNTAIQNLEKGKKGARKEDIDAMKSNIQGLRAQRKASQDALDDTYLKAPFSGVIAKKLVDNFQEVRAKQPVLSLQDIENIDILIDVPELFVAKIDEKAPPEAAAKFTAEAEFAARPGKRYPLKFKEFSTEADPKTQTYRVTLQMAQPGDLNVLPGMTATVIATPQRGMQGAVEIFIPAIAVFADEAGDSNVWIVDQETMTVQSGKVTTGELRGTDSIRIVSGLKAGDTVAISGVSQLRDGMKVRRFEP